MELEKRVENPEWEIMLLKQENHLLKKKIEQVVEDNLVIQGIVEKMFLHLSELRAEKEIMAVLLWAAAEAFNVTTSQLLWEFPQAWIRKTPKGVKSLLFGKNGKDYLENHICQARLLMVCMAKYIYDRTYGQIQYTFKWYSMRQDETVRQEWGYVLHRKPNYDRIHDKYVIMQQLVREKLEKDIVRPV